MTTEPPTEPGWYRRTDDGWEFVANACLTFEELPEAERADPLRLVLVGRDHVEVPLW